ncbi:hypothetical protein [Terribacillus halophilus]|uniref:hypothetical protein n=1 Tax=Terribacillus halophilus TaxID=361279 RepID=UPI000984B991|nr:hypothetical protein [Terribacillus halophilus]
MLLSRNDIIKELKRKKRGNIKIHPLNLDNIKGSSINLTVSPLAWKISDNKTAHKDGIITIPAHDTVCIYSNEAIWVSRRIGGTYHSKVTQVTEGLGHIGTTLDPQWKGLTLVGVTNHTDEDIELTVGDSFVTIMLYYLKTGTDHGIDVNAPSRSEIASKFEQTAQEKRYLREEWHLTFPGISKAMHNSDSYKELTKYKSKSRLRDLFVLPTLSNLLVNVIVAILTVLLTVYLTLKYLQD